ncbi:universal stress protein [Actinoallomurus iriomotensis]|uniref:universal stress protein n=1 Tax=Actinoallomurus iriomotensis TaxID=478107 RepID=UPI0025553584|nr:universal stress protein [Actinoallomurus iriomotensis]
MAGPWRARRRGVPLRPILVGVDGSAPGDAALRWAAHEASLRGVGLRVVHVFAGAPLVDDIGRNLDWEEAHHTVEDAHRRAEKISSELHVRSQVVLGGPAETLIRQSVEAGLVVLGKRGRGGFRDLLAGSVALQVAGHAAGPVVLVHSGWRPPIDDREIVVGAGREAALRAAFAEADLRGARLRALHAWRPIMPAGPSGLTPMTLAELEQNEEKTLTRTLIPWRERHPGVRVVESVVCDSSRHALTEASRTAELLVVGAREHFGGYTLALGTTAYAVIHHVTCPVLIAREPGRHRVAEPEESGAVSGSACSDGW